MPSSPPSALPSAPTWLPKPSTPLPAKIAAAAHNAISGAFAGLMKGQGARSGSGDAKRSLKKPAPGPAAAPPPPAGKLESLQSQPQRKRSEAQAKSDRADLLQSEPGEPGDAPVHPALSAALDALAKALEGAQVVLAAGAVPDAGPVEAARTALLQQLATASVEADVAALQRLLRSGLVELVAALRTPGTPAAALLGLCQARQRELVTARAALGGAAGGPPKGKKSGAFWGASV